MLTLNRLIANAGIVLTASVLAGCLACGPGTFEKNVDGDRLCLPEPQAGVISCGEGTHEWEEGRGGERECAPDVRCADSTEEKSVTLTPAEFEEGRGVERECVPKVAN